MGHRAKHPDFGPGQWHAGCSTGEHDDHQLTNGRTSPVTDLAFVIATVAFFALSVAFARALDRF